MANSYVGKMGDEYVVYVDGKYIDSRPTEAEAGELYKSELAKASQGQTETGGAPQGYHYDASGKLVSDWDGSTSTPGTPATPTGTPTTSNTGAPSLAGINLNDPESMAKLFNSSNSAWTGSPQLLQVILQSITAQATQAYQNKRLELIDLPMLAIAKDNMALQAAAEAANQALQTAGLMAQLRGPRNAFQSMAVATGLNNAGLSRGVDALAGRAILPSFSAPQAAPQAASLDTMRQDILAAGGKPPSISPFDIASGVANRYYNEGGGAGTTASTMTPEQAYDAIYGKRTDLADFYGKNNWDLSTPENKRKAVQDWLGMTTDPDVIAEGRDAMKLAKRWKLPGFATGGIVTQPTLALIGEDGPEKVTPLGEGFQVPSWGGNQPTDIQGAIGQQSPTFTSMSLPKLTTETTSAQPPATVDQSQLPPNTVYRRLSDYIKHFRADKGRDMTEAEWIQYAMLGSGLTYSQAKWIRDQGIANNAAGQGWADEATFVQQLTQAQAQKPVGQPAPRGNDWFEQMTNYWSDFQSMNGRQPTRDEMVAQVSTLSGQPPEAVANLYDKGYRYSQIFGKAAAKDIQERWMLQTTNPETPQGAYFTQDWLKDMEGWWARFQQQTGRKPNQQEYVEALKLATGSTDEAANEAWKQGTKYFNQTGVTMPQAEQEKLLTKLSSAAYQYGKTLPPPNKIVGREWLKMDKSTQETMLAAYDAVGYDLPYVMSMIQKGLPQFSSPKFAMVA